MKPNRLEFLLKLRLHELTKAIERTKEEIQEIRERRESIVNRDIGWMLRQCSDVIIDTTHEARRLCKGVLSNSGLEYNISTYEFSLSKRDYSFVTTKKFGKGPIFISWHIDSSSHKLFIDIWRDG